MNNTLNSQAPGTFAVLMTLKLDLPAARRFVIMKQYADNGLGANVKTIATMVMPLDPIYAAVILAEASSQAELETAFQPYLDIMKLDIIPLTNATIDPECQNAKYCVFAFNAPRITPARKYKNKEALLASVKVYATIPLPEGSPCSCIWLVDARKANDARKYGGIQKPDSLIRLRKAMTPQAFIQSELDGTAYARPAARVIADTPPTTGGVVSLCNVDNTTAYASWLDSNNPDFYTVINNRYSMSPDMPVMQEPNSFFYVWLAEYGSTNIFTYTPSGYVSSTFPTTYNVPLLCGGATPGPNAASPVTIDYVVAHNPGFSVSNPLANWLNELFTTQNFVAPWPEDGYAPDSMEYYAYQYILSGIPGQSALPYTVLPKDGHVPSAYINGITYPTQTPSPFFDEATFDAVYKQILDECSFFETVTQWYGANGIIDSLITQSVLSGSISLTSASNLMEVPNTSTVSVILGLAINTLYDMVSVIPEVGSACAAIINIAWTFSQAALSGMGGSATEPIQVAVSDMANELNNYLSAMTAATQNQYNLLNSNYGLLSTFALGATSQNIINAEQFQMSLPPVPPPGQQPTSGPTPPTTYIQTCANAWSVIIYKALFALPGFAPVVSVDPDSDADSNDWDPANGKYEYTYWIPGLYQRTSGKNINGYFNFTCESDAPDEAMAALFGPGGLNVSPLDFFLFTNGWTNPYTSLSGQISPYYDGHDDLISLN